MNVIIAMKVGGGGVKYMFIGDSKLEKLIQKRLLKTGLNKPKARELASLAKDCVQMSHARRPTAAKVASVLDHLT